MSPFWWRSEAVRITSGTTFKMLGFSCFDELLVACDGDVTDELELELEELM